ncbi:hypothetical protein [Streptomyces graminilatus]|uniref:hypothetical protein n=1 Tax=Streptomyces graminilatus TaxID=1464070 RepID=UPI0006E1D4B4|nr:hypothetical protein [Streptomyces graminilatus]
MSNEISYPFTADSAGGGSQMVTQAQWQYMSRQFAKDRVDYRLSAASLVASDLPFYAQVVNGTTVSIAPGRALVGGFYYQLTATNTVTIAGNTGALPRIDLIVLRANLTAGAVNLAVVQGQAAASPKVPVLTKTYGATWEMPLHQVSVPANSGAMGVINVMPFDTAEHVAVPWNVTAASALQSVGTFVYDMDNNTSDTQTEYFVGRDALAVTRDLGQGRTYTPSLVNVNDGLPSANRTGRWRWIAPGVVYFSLSIVNDYEDRGIVRIGSGAIGISLPQPAASATGQFLGGWISNPQRGGNMPNTIDISAHINKSSTAQTVAWLYYPSTSNLAEGQDWLPAIPLRSTVTISGVYETNTFGN